GSRTGAESASGCSNGFFDSSLTPTLGLCFTEYERKQRRPRSARQTRRSTRQRGRGPQGADLGQTDDRVGTREPADEAGDRSNSSEDEEERAGGRAGRARRARRARREAGAAARVDAVAGRRDLAL